MVDRVDFPSGLRIDLRMGNEEMLHSTAVGKAILAALDDTEVAALLGSQALSRQTPHTLTSVEAVLKDLRACRRRGYSIDDEEDFEGVLCVGAAIQDSTGKPVAAVSVTTLKARTSAKRVTQIGTALSAGARQISTRLGHAVADPTAAPPAAPAKAARATKSAR
jgi:IclR family transcriptional regulator, acetate operon repressor